MAKKARQGIMDSEEYDSEGTIFSMNSHDEEGTDITDLTDSTHITGTREIEELPLALQSVKERVPKPRWVR